MVPEEPTVGSRTLAFQLGDGAASTEWLVKKWSDVYMHETLIAHNTRLLDTDSAVTRSTKRRRSSGAACSM